jgi:hypothetical protein
MERIMDATAFATRTGASEAEPALVGTLGDYDAPAPGGRLTLAHEAGPRGGTWGVSNAEGKAVYSVGRRPFGGTRISVRDGEGTELASIGERVLSLVENHTIWRNGRPYARVYRPTRRAHGDRWFVEIGDHESWVVLTDSNGLRVLCAGQEVARLGCRDGRGLPRCVDMAPGVDVPLVLSLAALLHTIEESSV